MSEKMREQGVLHCSSMKDNLEKQQVVNISI